MSNSIDYIPYDHIGITLAVIGIAMAFVVLGGKWSPRLFTARPKWRIISPRSGYFAPFRTTW